MLRGPRPRPDHLEAKSKARTVRGQGQGHDFGSSSSRTVLEDPIPGKDIRGVSYSALESTAVCVYGCFTKHDLFVKISQVMTAQYDRNLNITITCI